MKLSYLCAASALMVVGCSDSDGPTASDRSVQDAAGSSVDAGHTSSMDASADATQLDAQSARGVDTRSLCIDDRVDYPSEVPDAGSEATCCQPLNSPCRHDTDCCVQDHSPDNQTVCIGFLCGVSGII